MINNLSKKWIIYVFFVVIHLSAFCQNFPIGKGWARNSINSTVFRKNAVTSINNTQFTSYYDSEGYVVLAKRTLGDVYWEVNRTNYKGNTEDAHNIISIAIDGNGYIHMAWDHHGHPLRYCMSKDSLGIELGEKQNMLGRLEQTVTYPEFFRMPNGDLTFIYRNGWSGNANCVINKYDVNEQKWLRLHDNLIDGENERSAYWQSCVDEKGVIHVSWVWRESPDVASNHDMCYAKSFDGGYSWYKSNGEKYTIPITEKSAEYVYRIEQESDLINQTSIYATADSRPFIASYWIDEKTNKVQYQIIYQDEAGNWNKKTFSNRQSNFSLSGGGTKKIPISRPQILVDDSGDHEIIYMLYRDQERGSRVSMNVCKHIEADSLELDMFDITDFSVGDWEPTYDIDLWKKNKKLDVFVQMMEQGDGETLSKLPAQPVYIWSVSTENTN